MGKMFDNFRAWWNSVSDSFSDPGKLAQLSVADLENAIKKAKDAAAPVIGRPVSAKENVDRLKSEDDELTTKIKALVAAGQDGVEAAKKYVERQVIVRKNLAEAEEDYKDAEEAAQAWMAKIRTLENELYNRRNKANDLQAEYETAKAEQALGKQFQNADSIAGTDSFSSLEARVDKEKAKAAGYSRMSGLDDKAKEDEIIRNAETDALLKEYLDNK